MSISCWLTPILDIFVPVYNPRGLREEETLNILVHESHTMTKLRRHSVQMSAKDDFDISSSLPYSFIVF